MPYNDEYRGDSKAAYDGELIDLADAVVRYDRDKKLQEKYDEAEENVPEMQMTWDDVQEELSKPSPMHDPRAGNVGATKPGDYLG